MRNITITLAFVGSLLGGAVASTTALACALPGDTSRGGIDCYDATHGTFGPLLSGAARFVPGRGLVPNLNYGMPGVGYVPNSGYGMPGHGYGRGRMIGAPRVVWHVRCRVSTLQGTSYIEGHCPR